MAVAGIEEHHITGVHVFTGLPLRSRIHFEMYDNVGALAPNRQASLVVEVSRNITIGWTTIVPTALVQTAAPLGYYRVELTLASLLFEPGSMLVKVTDPSAPGAGFGDPTIIHCNVWLRDTFGTL